MLPTYKNGDAMRAALPELKIGTRILYHNILHEVFDAGIEQGHRIGAIEDDRYDCPVHGLQDGPECARC